MIALGKLMMILRSYGTMKKILNVLAILLLIIATDIHTKAGENYEFG